MGPTVLGGEDDMYEEKPEKVWAESKLHMHYHQNEFDWDAFITGLASGILIGFTMGLVAWTHLPGG